MHVLHVTTDTGETDIVRRELGTVDPDLRVECAGTPREAIERLEAETSPYDAVLLDLAQMDGEGPSLVSHIRTHNLPVGVVAITSAREEGSSREALDCGADRLIVKDEEFLTRLPAVLAQAVERRTLEARLRLRLETAPACLMRVAGDGTILAMNIATLKMVDAKWADQVVDQSWYERVEPDAQAACRDFIERAAHGESGSFECQIEGLSGTRRTVLMHAVRAPVAASGVPSALVVMLDLDDTRGLEAALEQYRHKLGVVEKALSEVEAQNQQLTADRLVERAGWEQAEATRRQALVDEHQAAHEASQSAVASADAKYQQLSAHHEAERAAWEQQRAAGQAQERANVTQQDAEREKLQSVLQAADAQCQQLSTDLVNERAAWEQAEATRRQALVDEHQAAHEASQSALASADATYQQLSAHHEAERAAWEQQRAAWQAQERASVAQQGAEREKLESALQAATAQCQRLSTDLVSERAAWEQAEATRRQALVDGHQAAHAASQSALASADATYRQLSADHEAERAAWEQQRAAGQAQERANVKQQGAEREKLESALASADATYQQLSADHEAERAAWERAEATRRQALVDEHEAAHEAVQSALASADAEYQQLSADHEAERAAWEQQLAQERASVKQQGVEGEKLESALKAADAQCQQLSTDLTAWEHAWEHADATSRRALVHEHQAAREASQSALASADAKYQQLSTDHEAERAAWEQQRAAWQAQERASVTPQAAERDKLEQIRQRQRLESAQQASASRALQDRARHGQSPDVRADVEKLAGTGVTQRAVVPESLPKQNPRQEATASLSTTPTHRFQAVSRTHQRTTRTMDLSAAIGQLGPILRSLVGDNIEFEVEPASRLDPVTINPDHVERLLMSLALVVREAMPAGGVVRLGTSNVEIDDAHRREYPGVPPGPYARLTLRASGWGMDPQVQDRVSSAVASGEASKEAKELGLASALRAFRQAGGHIAVEAEPGQKLTFDGYLPTVTSRRSSSGPSARSEREIRDHPDPALRDGGLRLDR